MPITRAGHTMVRSTQDDEPGEIRPSMAGSMKGEQHFP
jgi:hypothetical protein